MFSWAPRGSDDHRLGSSQLPAAPRNRVVHCSNSVGLLRCQPCQHINPRPKAYDLPCQSGTAEATKAQRYWSRTLASWAMATGRPPSSHHVPRRQVLRSVSVFARRTGVTSAHLPISAGDAPHLNQSPTVAAPVRSQNKLTDDHRTPLSPHTPLASLPVSVSPRPVEHSMPHIRLKA